MFCFRHANGEGKNEDLIYILYMISVKLTMVTADVNTCYRHHASSGATLSDGMRIRLLSAQRDMYITGFALFLFL